MSANTNVNGTITVNSGGTLTLNSGPYALNGSISSSGTTTLNSLTGTNTYSMTGGINVSAGTVTVIPNTVNPNIINMNTGITVSGGQLTFSNSSGTAYTLNMSNAIAVSGGTLTFNPDTYNLTNGITVSGGTLTSNSGTYTFTAKGGVTVSGAGKIGLSGGTYTFYGPITTSSTAQVTLNGGIYILDSTSTATPLLFTQNSSSVTGTGVTLVFKSTVNPRQYPNPILDTHGASTLTLTAPTTGATKGLVIFGDRSMPTSTQFEIENGTTLTFTGAYYAPHGQIVYAGAGASQTPCSQLIADSFSFANGTGSFANNCGGYGTTPIVGHGGSSLLVE